MLYRRVDFLGHRSSSDEYFSQNESVVAKELRRIWLSQPLSAAKCGLLDKYL